MWSGLPLFSNYCHLIPSYASPHEGQAHQYFCSKFYSQIIISQFSLNFYMYERAKRYIFHLFSMAICFKTPYLSPN